MIQRAQQISSIRGWIKFGEEGPFCFTCRRFSSRMTGTEGQRCRPISAFQAGQRKREIMDSKYSGTDRMAREMLDWVDPGVVAEESWTEMAAELVLEQKIVAQEQL